MNIQEIKLILQKEWTVEWRQKYALQGVFWYSFTIVFLCYLSFGTLKPIVWLSLFWILNLFTSVNAITKSFVGESKSTMHYFYTLFSGKSVLMAKTLYHWLLVLFLSGALLAFYSLLLGFPVQRADIFFTGIFLGTSGLSVALTFLSAISHKARSGASVMAVLSFPVLIPIILLSIKISKMGMDGLPWSTAWHEIGQILGIILLTGALSHLLFPYLWRD
jgi:heme exporter protein B